MAIAIFLGFSYQTDSFFFAASLITIVAIGAGALDSVGLPNLIKAKRKSKKAFNTLSAQLLCFVTAMTIISVILAVLLAPFSGYFAWGFSATAKQQTVFLFTLLLPYLGMFYFNQHFAAVLRAQRLFTIQATSDFLSSLVQMLVIGFGTYFYRSILCLPLAMLLGILVALIFQIVFIREHLRFSWMSKDIFKKIFKQYWLYSLIAIINSIFIFVDRFFGSFLPEKSISALFYGLTIVTVLLNIVKLDQMFFTAMSEKLSRVNFMKFLKVALAISIPYMILLITFPEFIVKLLVGYGRFSNWDIQLTAEAIRFYAWGIPGMYIIGMFNRVLMLQENTSGIILLTLVSVFFNIVCNYLFLFVLHLGVGGLALATSIVIYLIAILQLWQIAKYKSSK